MNLRHYSPEPLLFDSTRTYTQSDIQPYGKPRGLWLSVEDPADDSGWKQWCASEGFNTEGLQYFSQFELDPGARILRITNAEELIRFDRANSRSVNRTPADRSSSIDWRTVAEQYDGILIAPYQWSCRMTIQWYYGWDCASACIWNLKAFKVGGGS